MPQRHRSHNNTEGFTLTEMSIVLVIIGLIIGAIFVGHAMLRASELRSVISDVAQFTAAVNTFKLDYDALPGDMPNATLMWGTASGGCPNGARTGTQTCDGDNNGQVSGYAPESFTFWQHLANANLIPGQYTGQDGPVNNGYDSVIGVNVPASKYPGGGYGIGYWGSNPFAGGWFPGLYGHTITFGGQTVNNNPGYGILLPSDALSVDIKNDDGLPGQGQIVTYPQGAAYNNANCATTTDPTTAIYNTAFNAPTCILMFKNRF